VTSAAIATIMMRYKYKIAAQLRRQFKGGSQ